MGNRQCGLDRHAPWDGGLCMHAHERQLVRLQLQDAGCARVTGREFVDYV